MERINNPLFTQKYTYVECEPKEEQLYNAPHHFIVKEVKDDSKVLAIINFQEGPINEVGINGINNEDLLLMVIERLKAFQNGKYATRENEMALTKLEEAVMWLRKRTLEREYRNIEGTSEV